MEIAHILVIAFVAMLAIALFKDRAMKWLTARPKLLVPLLIVALIALVAFFLTAGGESLQTFIEEDIAKIFFFVQLILMFIALAIRQIHVGVILLITTLVTLIFFV